MPSRDNVKDGPDMFRLPVNILVEPSAVEAKSQAAFTDLWKSCVQEAKAAGLYTVSDMQVRHTTNYIAKVVQVQKEVDYFG